MSFSVSADGCSRVCNVRNRSGSGDDGNWSIGSIVVGQIVIGKVKERVIHAGCGDTIGAIQHMRRLRVTFAEIGNDLVITNDKR